MNLHIAPKVRPAFTLIELLVVIAIIGILAALLLPVINRMKVNGEIRTAEAEALRLALAIHQYESTYGHFPASTDAMKAVGPLQEDFTYGSQFQWDTGETEWLAGPGSYQVPNAEMMAALLDLTVYSDGRPTMNQGHAKNWKKIRFLDAQRSTDPQGPGLGIDGVLRDPWGNPYFVALDLNGDGLVRDIFYRRPAVTESPDAASQGLKGFVQGTDRQGDRVFELRGRVMVWSMGPDRRLDRAVKINQGRNRDNIVVCR